MRKVRSSHYGITLIGTTMDIVTKAKLYAAVAHEGQRYGTGPYTDHLGQVVQVLIDFNITDENLLAAGWLHDTLEDTDTTLLELESIFGNRIASLVDALTDGQGGTRKERKARPYALIPTVKDAAVLKLADRIANVEEASQNKVKRFIKLYRKEHEGFTQALYNGQYQEMWDRLESAIFNDVSMSHKEV